MSKAIKDYLYLDKERLAMYYDQVPEEYKRPEGEVSSEISLSLFGLSGRIGRTKRRVSATQGEQLEILRRHLRTTQDLVFRRPIVMNEAPQGPRFVEESMIAQKVIIPTKHLPAVPDLKSIALWVSEPDQGDLSVEAYSSSGTFVYLVEAFWDAGAFSTVLSGCSALQAIANVATGRALFSESADGREPLGRDGAEHPIRKLRELDAQPQEPRRIRSLYRKRYMSDEQCFTVDGQEYRANDLLAYPLYIAAE